LRWLRAGTDPDNQTPRFPEPVWGQVEQVGGQFVPVDHLVVRYCLLGGQRADRTSDRGGTGSACVAQRLGRRAWPPVAIRPSARAARARAAPASNAGCNGQAAANSDVSGGAPGKRHRAAAPDSDRDSASPTAGRSLRSLRQLVESRAPSRKVGGHRGFSKREETSQRGAPAHGS
jgi:hypothetical protein